VSSVSFVVPSSPVGVLVNGNNIVRPWQRKSVLQICAATKVIIDVKVATPDVVAMATMATVPDYNSTDYQTACSQASGGPGIWAAGDRTGITVDGPYLAYRVALGSMSGEMGNTDIHLGDYAAIRGNYEAGMAGATPDFLEWVFDLQCKRPILLPYPGSLEVLGNIPGTWQFNVWAVELARLARESSPLESEVTLTAQIAASAASQSSRFFNAIPFGAHSYVYRDNSVALGAFPTTEVFAALPATRLAPVGPGENTIANSIVLNDYNNQSSQFLGRTGLANAASLLQNGPAGASSRGVAVFHVSIV
jgi:hypothetical protein